MSTAPEERVPTSSILIYSSPVLGVFMATMLVNFYLLKFSTDVLLIAPATIGFLLLLARVWDAVTDPAAGWLSDRTNTRLGRRRPWFLGSALPLGGAIVMLWSPPADLDGTALTVWIGAAILLFFTAYTAFRVPHIAMGAELSRGYHDRTRVFGVMQMVESVGMLAAAGVLVFLEQAEDPRGFARVLSLGMGAFATVLILLAAWRLRERTEFLGRGGASPWRSFRDVLANPHSRILIGVFFLEQLGFGALVALIPYLSDYVLETPGSTGIYLFGAIGAALLSIPAWIYLSRRIGKIRIWRFSIVAKAVLFAMAFFLGAGDFLPMLIIATLFGVMNGCGSVVGPSLKADVVDWDEAETGERKEGSYFAAWNFVQKSAAGVAVWAIGVMLTVTGFVPNVPQSGETLLGIRSLASAIPSLLHVLALILMLRFSLDEAAHVEARRRADKRLAGQS
jgi:GPH family glycoside/pentoside/hexuronide:cation symporter